MKPILAMCLTLSLIAGLAGQASAETNRKHKSKARNYDYSIRQARAKSVPSNPNLTPEWYPHDSSVLPFGSQLWWRQKEREGGGTSRD